MEFDPAMLQALLADRTASTQKVIADRIRSGKGQLAEANQNAHGLDLLNFAAGASNNPALQQSMGGLTQSRQAQFAPKALGQTGMMLPASGEFVENPAYANDRESQRQSGQQNVLLKMIEAQQTAKQAAETRREVAAQADATRRYGIDENNTTRQLIAALRPEPAAKPLPANVIKDVTKLETMKDRNSQLSSSFKDEYNSVPVLGNAINSLGRTGVLGDKYENQANWWQEYSNHVNEIRHTLFGSALTKTESAAFDRANVVPGMSAKSIRESLAQRDKAATSAYNKLVANMARGGYNMSEFAAAPVPEAAVPGQVTGKITKPANDGWSITPSK